MRNLFEKAENEGGTFLISMPVLLELIWVLGAVYGCSRADILAAIEQQLLLLIIDFQAQDRVREFFQIGRNSRIELSDLLIGLTAVDAKASPALTFDKKASKSALFSLL